MVGCCWTEERERALIAFYSEHSCLWDQQHHNRRLRLELLEQLSRRLSDPAASVSVEDVKRKFRNLRTVFHREHRCVQASRTSGRRHLSRWKHYQRLLFLCGSCDKEEDQEEDQEENQEPPEEDQEPSEEDQERGNLATSSAERNGSSGHAPPDRFSRSSTPSGGGARRRGAARSLSLDKRAPSWLTSGRAHAGPLRRSTSSSASSASSARPGRSRRRSGGLRRHWSDRKVQQLISFYSDHRCLWSHRSEGYRNRLLKQGLLEMLSSLLSQDQDQDQADSFTVEDVKTKFRNLRTIFQREHRAAASNKTCGSEDFYLPKWKHYQELMFLCDSCNEKEEEEEESCPQLLGPQSPPPYLGDAQSAADLPVGIPSRSLGTPPSPSLPGSHRSSPLSSPSVSPPPPASRGQKWTRAELLRAGGELLELLRGTPGPHAGFLRYVEECLHETPPDKVRRLKRKIVEMIHSASEEV